MFPTLNFCCINKYRNSFHYIGEVIVDFHVLDNEVGALNNIAISTFLQSLPLASLVLTRTVT